MGGSGLGLNSRFFFLGAAAGLGFGVKFNPKPEPPPNSGPGRVSGPIAEPRVSGDYFTRYKRLFDFWHGLF